MSSSVFPCGRCDEKRKHKPHCALNFPTIVCLVGSRRFKKEFEKVTLQQSVLGKVVLSLAHFSTKPQPFHRVVKPMLVYLHRQKIAMAHEVFVVNPGGYVGLDTAGDLLYASSLKKKITWLVPTTYELEKAPWVSKH